MCGDCRLVGDPEVKGRKSSGEDELMWTTSDATKLSWLGMISISEVNLDFAWCVYVMRRHPAR